jgi:lipopolysaccharide export system permease protein
MMTLVLLLFSSTVIPLATSKAEEIRVIYIEKKLRPAVLKLPLPWTRVDADHSAPRQQLTLGGDTLAGAATLHFRSAFRLIDMNGSPGSALRQPTWTLQAGISPPVQS